MNVIILSKLLAYNWALGYNLNWDPTTQRYSFARNIEIRCKHYFKILAQLLLGLFSIQYYRNYH